MPRRLAHLHGLFAWLRQAPSGRLVSAVVAASIGIALAMLATMVIGPRVAGADYEPFPFTNDPSVNHNANPNVEPMHAAEAGGTATPVLRNWDCGCPPLELRPEATTPEQRAALHQKWPYGYVTRCLKENHSSNLKAGNAPINDRGRPYPAIQYPPGFPASDFLPDNLGIQNNQIPFPGWPQNRYHRDHRLENWGHTDRTAYRNGYRNAGTPPGDVDRSEFGNYSAWLPQRFKWSWHFFQIHHILERQYGGTNTRANLVPILTYWNSRVPREDYVNGQNPRPNLHNEFTQWWGRLTVDADLVACEETIKKLPASDERARTMNLIDTIKQCKVADYSDKGCRIATSTSGSGQ